MPEPVGKDILVTGSQSKPDLQLDPGRHDHREHVTSEARKTGRSGQSAALPYTSRSGGRRLAGQHLAKGGHSPMLRPPDHSTPQRKSAARRGPRLSVLSASSEASAKGTVRKSQTAALQLPSGLPKRGMPKVVMTRAIFKHVREALADARRAGSDKPTFAMIAGFIRSAVKQLSLGRSFVESMLGEHEEHAKLQETFVDKVCSSLEDGQDSAALSDLFAILDPLMEEDGDHALDRRDVTGPFASQACPPDSGSVEVVAAEARLPGEVSELVAEISGSLARIKSYRTFVQRAVQELEDLGLATGSAVASSSQEPLEGTAGAEPPAPAAPSPKLAAMASEKSVACGPADSDSACRGSLPADGPGAGGTLRHAHSADVQVVGAKLPTVRMAASKPLTAKKGPSLPKTAGTRLAASVGLKQPPTTSRPPAGPASSPVLPEEVEDSSRTGSGTNSPRGTHLRLAAPELDNFGHLGNCCPPPRGGPIAIQSVARVRATLVKVRKALEGLQNEQSSLMGLLNDVADSYTGNGNRDQFKGGEFAENGASTEVTAEHPCNLPSHDRSLAGNRWKSSTSAMMVLRKLAQWSKSEKSLGAMGATDGAERLEDVADSEETSVAHCTGLDGSPGNSWRSARRIMMRRLSRWNLVGELAARVCETVQDLPPEIIEGLGPDGTSAAESGLPRSCSPASTAEPASLTCTGTSILPQQASARRGSLGPAAASAQRKSSCPAVPSRREACARGERATATLSSSHGAWRGGGPQPPPGELGDDAGCEVAGATLLVLGRAGEVEGGGAGTSVAPGTAASSKSAASGLLHPQEDVPLTQQLAQAQVHSADRAGVPLCWQGTVQANLCSASWRPLELAEQDPRGMPSMPCTNPDSPAMLRGVGAVLGVVGSCPWGDDGPEQQPESTDGTKARSAPAPTSCIAAPPPPLLLFPDDQVLEVDRTALREAADKAARLREELGFASLHEPALAHSPSQEMLVAALGRREREVLELRRRVRAREAVLVRELGYRQDAHGRPRPPAPATRPLTPCLATAGRSAARLPRASPLDGSLLLARPLRRRAKPKLLRRLDVISDEHSALAAFGSRGQLKMGSTGGLHTAATIKGDVELHLWGWNHGDLCRRSVAVCAVPDVPRVTAD